MTKPMLWQVYVDWDDTGDLSGAVFGNEAANAIALRTERGRDKWLQVDGNGMATGMGRVSIGRASLTVLDREDRYDPYNASSDIITNGGTIGPGHLAIIRVDPNDDTDVKWVFTGRLRDIKPVSGGKGKVYLEFEELLADLQKSTPDIVLDTDVLISDAIEDVLTAAAWPVFAGTSIAATSHLMSYWYSVDKTCLETINELADAEVGVFWTSADGTATFADYDEIIGISTIAPWTADLLLKKISLPNLVDNHITKINVTGHATALGVEGVLWTCPEVLEIADGVPLTQWVEFTGFGQNVLAESIVDPYNTTDFIINSEADGSGVDLFASADMTVVGGSSYGTKTPIQFDYTDPGIYPVAYIIFAQLRGANVWSSPTYLTYGAGLQTYELDSPWIQTWEHAADLINYLNVLFITGPNATARRFPIVQMEGQQSLQFIPDLFSVVTLTDVITAGDIKCTVGKIVHEWLFPTGQGVRSTFYLEEFTEPPA